MFGKVAGGFVAASIALAAMFAEACAQESFPVAIEVNAARGAGELKSIWRFFGGDEPNYATMRDGRALLDVAAPRRGEGPELGG